jgi:hypothetical protein
MLKYEIKEFMAKFIFWQLFYFGLGNPERERNLLKSIQPFLMIILNENYDHIFLPQEQMNKTKEYFGWMKKLSEAFLFPLNNLTLCGLNFDCQKILI